MARFFKKHGILFQHIPRTGGTTVEWYIKQSRVPERRWLHNHHCRVCKKHALLHQYNRDSFNDVRFIFAFVRHPVAYYASVWKWMTKVMNGRIPRKKRNWIQQRYDWHPMQAPFQYWDSNFDNWVRAMLQQEPSWCTRLFETYVGPIGAPLVNYIGQTETLHEDMNVILELCGYPIPEVQAPHNVIVDPVVWDPGLRREVERTEVPTIRRFYG